MNKTELFLSNIRRLSEHQIPDTVINRARESLLDYIAVTSAGAKFQSEKINRYLLFSIPECGNSTAIGVGKFALKEAVFLNGLNAHALDMDDGCNSGIIHLGSPIFSLLLPLAERYEKTTDEVLKAAIVGYETAFTMAVSIQPRHKYLGYHATGTCGILGATVAAGIMLEFEEDEMFAAFSAACISASGMLSALDDGSEMKPYNVAKASLLALTSIQLAKSGFKGNSDPLGKNRGYLKMMTGTEEVELEAPMLNGMYAIMKTYTKPFASCRYTHPSIEAIVKLREQVPLNEINSIDIRTYSLAVNGHDHTDISGSYSAKMSIPYSVAVGFIYGKAGLHQFDPEIIKQKKVIELTRKIKVEGDEKLSADFPERQVAIVKIIKNDGTTLTEKVDYPKGEPENPLSPMEFRQRYDELMLYAAQRKGDEVYEGIFENKNICEITKWLI